MISALIIPFSASTFPLAKSIMSFVDSAEIKIFVEFLSAYLILTINLQYLRHKFSGAFAMAVDILLEAFVTDIHLRQTT